MMMRKKRVDEEKKVFFSQTIKEFNWNEIIFLCTKAFRLLLPFAFPPLVLLLMKAFLRYAGFASQQQSHFPPSRCSLLKLLKQLIHTTKWSFNLMNMQHSASSKRDFSSFISCKHRRTVKAISLSSLSAFWEFFAHKNSNLWVSSFSPKVLFMKWIEGGRVLESARNNLVYLVVMSWWGPSRVWPRIRCFMECEATGGIKVSSLKTLSP